MSSVLVSFRALAAQRLSWPTICCAAAALQLNAQGVFMSSGDNNTFQWLGAFSNTEIHSLHAEAFETRLFDESE